MSLIKFASASVIDAKLARQGQGLVKDAHRHEFDYDPRPGFLYVRSRAISSRTNDNFDHFPAEEIRKGWRTFIGKPVFVNHHNDNHRRARGVIVDAALHEDTNPDGSEDTWVEVLMEVDAVRFPKLAQAILAGEIDRTSMGTDVEFSVCSVCNNKASTPLEYCAHIPKLKGKKVRRKTASGGTEDVLVYEKCYGLRFFENSLLVEEPADPTALTLGVDARGMEGLLDMPPRSARADRHDGSGGDPVPLRNLAQREGATLPSASPDGDLGQQVPLDDEHVGLRQSAGRIARPWEAATSRHHVSGVVPVGSEDPVGRVVAERHVAGVADDLAFGDRADEGLVPPAVRAHARPLGVREGQPAVPVREGAASPRPAVVGSSDLDLGPVARKNAHPGQHSDLGVDDRGLQSTASRRTAISAAELERMSRIVTEHLGHYNSAVTWLLQNRPDASVEQVANVIAERDGSAVERMTGQPGYIKDYDVWWPKMLEATQRMLSEIRATDTTARRRTASRKTANLDWWQVVVHRRGDEVPVVETEGKNYEPMREAAQAIAADPQVISVTIMGLGPSNGDYIEKIARRHAINETMAPAKVDTLRDESCPVCGEADSYDGDTCAVCGFIRPPDEFMEPDLEKAQQIDLRQDEQADEMAAGDPTALQDGEADPLEEAAPGDPEGSDKPWELKERPVDDAEPTEGEDDEDSNASGGTKPWELRTRPKKRASRTEGTDVGMRPALAALAEQQKIIEGQRKQLRAQGQLIRLIANAAGIDGNPRVAALLKHAEDENPAQPKGWANDGGSAPEAPAATTSETLGDLNADSVETQGGTSEQDVQPDATTSLDSTETVLDEPLDLNEQDVTAPVAGTDDLGQGGRGNANTNRTETDVRIGDPNKSDVAFAETGWTTSSKSSEGRTIAALRLARLRMQAGIESADADDLSLSTAIASSDVTDEAIQTEIDALAKVVVASGKGQRQTVARNLVPQAARQAQRTMPSFAGEPQVPMQTVASGPSDDEFAFE